jgi:hypothetical protein
VFRGPVNILCFFLTETNQLTLESIAGRFGDDTISTEKIVVAMTEHAETEAVLTSLVA